MVRTSLITLQHIGVKIVHTISEATDSVIV